MSKVIITLLKDEKDALVRCALDELRTPRDQARFIVRKLLVEKGYLNETPMFSDPKIIGGQNATPVD